MEQRLVQLTGTDDCLLQVQIDIHAPIERVWQSISDARHVGEWWAAGHIGRQPGEPVTLGENKEINGSIVTFLPPFVFAFTWHDDPEHAVRSEWLHHPTSSLVHYNLVVLSDTQTRLTLQQYTPQEVAAGAAAGWHHLMERLAQYVENGTIDEDPGRFETLKQLYQDPSQG